MITVASLSFVAVCAAAAVSDVLARRVSNRLNLAILAIGLGWRALLSGPGAVLLGAAGAAAGLALLIVPFSRRWIGAGDVKLVAALGAWLGPGDVVWAALCGLAASGALSVAVAAAGGRALVREAVDNLKISALTLSAPAAPRRANRSVVPLAVPLAGAAVVIFLRGGGM